MYTKLSFLILLICLGISCKKDPIVIPEKSASLAAVRFTDITTGMPIKNIKVIIANNSMNGFQIIDSAYSDSNGSITVKRSGSRDFVVSYSIDYFQEDFQEVYQDSVEINLYPKMPVNIHFKQVNLHKNPHVFDITLCLLPEVEGFQLTSTNSLALISRHSLFGTTMNPRFFESLNISFPLKEDQFIDTTIEGYLHKNFYNSIKYSIAENWGSDGYYILKSENSPMIHPATLIPNEILIEF